MQIDIVANTACSYDGIIFVLSGKCGEYAVIRGINYRAFFNPADFVFLCTDFEKALAVLQHLKLLAVHNLRDAVGYGRYAILQVHLPGCDVHGVVLLMAYAAAAAREEQKQCRKREDMPDLNARDR